MNVYTAADMQVWKTLFERQVKNLQNKACQEYLDALQMMNPVLNAHSIPDFSAVDEWFSNSTGWKMKVVPGLIPVDEFFELLACKTFCSSTWLRTMDQLDYLEEPDMFHDTFGHIPLLSNPVFSDFMQQFGELGCSMKNDEEMVLELQRLYWFTIEFGMIGHDDPKIYGAGICSSFGETNRAMNAAVSKMKFDMYDVLKKPFRTDVVQEEYICIASFKEMFDALKILKSERLCVGK